MTGATMQPLEAGVDWSGIDASAITVRGTVPDDQRTRDGYRAFYQSPIDDLNATAAALGWRGAQLRSHGFNLEEGLVEISAIEGKVTVTLAHVKAIASKDAS